MSTPCNKYSSRRDVQSMQAAAVAYEQMLRYAEEDLHARFYSYEISDAWQIEQSLMGAIESQVMRFSDTHADRATAHINDETGYSERFNDSQSIEAALKAEARQQAVDGKTPWRPSALKDPNGLQGDWGENHAAELLAEKLGFQDIGFTPQDKGFDGIYKDSNGVYYAVEAKFTESIDGRKDLEPHPTLNGEDMKQAGVGWSRDRLQKLHDKWEDTKENADVKSQDRISNLTNAMIADEIMKAGVENLQRMVVHTNTATLTTTAFVPDPNDSSKWVPFRQWAYDPMQK